VVVEFMPPNYAMQRSALVSVTFRQSTDAEWSSAYDLTRENMAIYYAASDRTWDTSTFRDSWPMTENFTLELAGMPVGFLRLAQMGETLWVRDIQIARAAQGQGVGSFAISLAERIARERGAVELRLRVFDSNPAVRLYLRRGFRRAAHDGSFLTLEKSAA